MVGVHEANGRTFFLGLLGLILLAGSGPWILSAEAQPAPLKQCTAILLLSCTFRCDAGDHLLTVAYGVPAMGRAECGFALAHCHGVVTCGDRSVTPALLQDNGICIAGLVSVARCIAGP